MSSIDHKREGDIILGQLTAEMKIITHEVMLLRKKADDIDEKAGAWKRTMEDDLTREEEADLRQLLGMFRTARGLFFKSFVGLAIIGAVALMGIGAIKEIFR